MQRDPQVAETHELSYRLITHYGDLAAILALSQYRVVAILMALPADIGSYSPTLAPIFLQRMNDHRLMPQDRRATRGAQAVGQLFGSRLPMLADTQVGKCRRCQLHQHGNECQDRQ
ncbi:hypothetical protein D3C76_480500 [compost metagenome]